MSDISAVSGTAPKSASSIASIGLANNFDNYLTLLTAQLKYQDPLEPVDPKEFTQQLVQLTSVEQAIQTNANLEKIIENLTANTSASVVNFIGKEIEAEGTTGMLTEGEATWNYSLASDAESVEIRILDANGSLVYATTGNISSGDHTFTWDGTDNNGVSKPDGLYTISIKALDQNGNDVGVSTAVVGVVTGFETTAEGIILNVGQLKVPYSDVTAVRAPLQAGSI